MNSRLPATIRATIFAISATAIIVGIYAFQANAANTQSTSMSPVFSTGQDGQVSNLNGTNQDVAVGDPENLKVSSALTISAWVNPSSQPASTDLAAVVTKWNGTLNGNAYGLWLKNNGSNLQVVAGVNPTSGAEETVVGGNVPLNSWTNVAMTYNASNSSLVIYVNGKSVGATIGSPSTIKATDTNVYIGSERDGAGKFFSGSIGQVDIFNRALTASEIASINAARPSIPATPTPTPTPTPLVLNGHGSLNVAPNPREFIMTDIEMTMATKKYFVGQFSYQDNAAKLSFTTGLLTSVTITGNTATFSGETLTEGTHGKKITFTVNVTANQSPPSNDTFSISTSNGYSFSGNAIVGTITITPPE